MQASIPIDSILDWFLLRLSLSIRYRSDHFWGNDHPSGNENFPTPILQFDHELT